MRKTWLYRPLIKYSPISDQGLCMNICTNHLRGINLFKGIAYDKIITLSTYFKSEFWERGSFPINPQKCKHWFYIIFSGRMKVFQINSETGREHTLYILSTGDVYSIVTLLGEEKQDLLTETIDPLVVYAITLKKMREFMRENPSVYQNLMQFLAMRLRCLEKATVDLSLSDTRTRLARLLIYHFDKRSNELVGINQLSHNEIANMLGTTRAVLNRHLQEFKKTGAIDVERKRIKILDIKLLKGKFSKP